MGVTLDYVVARSRLSEAIEWAFDEARPVPEKWVELTRSVGGSRNKTVVAVLGTALLAMAVRSDVDPLSLKEAYADDTYSARTLCHSVLVPASQDLHHPFDLGARGREPLNNQPFFRYDHLSLIERSRSLDLLERLIAELPALRGRGAEERLGALAAFVRVRAEAEQLRRAQFGGVEALSISRLSMAIRYFLRSGTTDRPNRLQAVAGGLVAAVAESVSAQSINDPSRRAPGDLHVPDERTPRWSAEVRGKPVTPTEARAFVDVCSQHGIPLVWLIIDHQDHRPLDRAMLRTFGVSQGVLVNVIESVEELIAELLSHPSVILDAATGVHSRIAEQLELVRATTDTLHEWARVGSEPVGREDRPILE